MTNPHCIAVVRVGFKTAFLGVWDCRILCNKASAWLPASVSKEKIYMLEANPKKIEFNATIPLTN